MNPKIGLYKTKMCYYLLSIIKNRITEINEESFVYLSQNKSIDPNMLKGELLELYNNGLLDDSIIENIEHPISKLLPMYLDNRVNSLTLQVTQDCNLVCSYCPYTADDAHRGHHKKQMSFEIAKKAIDEYISRSSNMNEFNFSFYGGEPLLNFNLIKTCVEYIKSMIKVKPVQLRMTTNGTLLSDTIADYLVKHDFTVTISIDGPKEIHDRNRRFTKSNYGSFDIIMANIEKMKVRYPDFVKENLLFNSVLDGREDYKCTSEFLNNYETIKDLTVMSSFINDMYADEMPEVDDEFFSQYNYERFLVYLSKIGELNTKYTNKIFDDEFDNLKVSFTKNYEQPINTEQDHPSGPCIPGVQKLFVDIYGNYYPCEKISEKSSVAKIGHVDTGLEVERILPQLDIGKLTEQVCKSCWAFRYCMQCVIDADGFTELSMEKRLRRCDEVKSNVLKQMIKYSTLSECGVDFFTNGIEVLS